MASRTLQISESLFFSIGVLHPGQGFVPQAKQKRVPHSHSTSRAPPPL